MNTKVENVLKKIIQVIAIIILLFLTITSVLGTAQINGKEVTTYVADNPIIHLIAICAVLALIYFIRKKKIKISKKAIIIFICVWAVIIISWILMTQLYPRADQKYILNSATELLKGDTSSFDTKGYAGANPHQIPLIFFEAITGIVLGKYNFLGLQFLNIFAILVSVFAMYKITRIMFKNRQTSIGTIFALFLFAPLSFYVTFIYGNLYGLATSTVAVWLMLKYLEGNKIRYLFISSICLELSVLFKSNYIITLVAMICLIFLYAIKEKKIKLTLSVILLIAVYVLGNFGISFLTKTVTGKEKNAGIPMKSYIAMGLQESNRAPGWYNGYNRKVYKKNKNNTEKAEVKVDTKLDKLISKFTSDPQYALNFFYYKTVSQWNNPTFQCFWINRARRSNIELNPIAKSIKTEGTVAKGITIYMNIVQTLILFGATIYLIIDFKNIKAKQLSLIIIFIGGFLFHLIWEAKCQYTMTYFVLLIPYSVRGYLKFADKILQRKKKNDNIKEIKVG